MERISEQIKSLDIPYPQRHLLSLEVCHDLEHDPDAKDRRHAEFSRDVLEELEAIHATKLHQFLKRFGESRRTIETFLAFLPLMLTLFWITEEKEMVDFIREGGAGMYGILFIGLFLLGKEVLNALRVVVVKDHSDRNLRIDTPSVLLGCLALMLVSVGSTILGFYKSADGLAQFYSADGLAKSGLRYDFLLFGAKESLANVVLGSFLCAVVVLAHYGTRRALHVWQAPVVD